jgi:hypothetical protein
MNSPRDSGLSALSRVGPRENNKSITSKRINAEAPTNRSDSDHSSDSQATNPLGTVQFASVPVLPEYVMQQLLHLWTDHQLRENISKVCPSPFLRHPYGPRSYGLAYSAKVDRGVLLFLCRFRLRVRNHGRVITKYGTRLLQRDAHHAMFVPQSLDHFNRQAHREQLRSIRRSLNSVLLLGVSQYRCTIHINQNP